MKISELGYHKHTHAIAHPHKRKIKHTHTYTHTQIKYFVYRMKPVCINIGLFKYYVMRMPNNSISDHCEDLTIRHTCICCLACHPKWLNICPCPWMSCPCPWRSSCPNISNLPSIHFPSLRYYRAEFFLYFPGLLLSLSILFFDLFFCSHAEFSSLSSSFVVFLNFLFCPILLFLFQMFLLYPSNSLICLINNEALNQS